MFYPGPTGRMPGVASRGLSTPVRRLALLLLAASGLLTYLPLILVPPAVGVMAYGTQIMADATAILVTLGVSLAVSLPFCGWLMQKMIERQDRRNGQ